MFLALPILGNRRGCSWPAWVQQRLPVCSFPGGIRRQISTKDVQGLWDGSSECCVQVLQALTLWVGEGVRSASETCRHLQRRPAGAALSVAGALELISCLSSPLGWGAGGGGGGGHAGEGGGPGASFRRGWVCPGRGGTAGAGGAGGEGALLGQF